MDALNLLKRSNTCYYDAFGRYRCRSSGWSNWGRWIVVGVCILIFVAFLSCVCLTSRRRRRAGAKPMYGTGWIPTGGQQNNNYNQPPPQYGAPPQQENYNYAPPQESGYAPPPQPPKPAYNGGGQQGYEMYNPPQGPPPNRYG